MDWREVFFPSQPPLEIFLRGTIIYLALFFLLRVVMKREEGMVGLTDVLVIVLLADASQNAMAGGYESVTDGLLLVLTILGWSYALTWVAYRFPRVRRLIRPPPLLLVRDGQVLRSALRRELLTEEELMGKLRNQGIDDVRKVKRAYMETDGTISAIVYEGVNRRSQSATRPHHV